MKFRGRISIRKAQVSDIGYFLELITRFWTEESFSYPIMEKKDCEEQALTMLTRMKDPAIAPWLIYLLAFDGKRPIGYLIGIVQNRDYGEPKRFALCQELYVIRDKRHTNAAYRLVQEAIRAAISLGAEALECVGTYDGTDKRWQRFGFRPYDTYLYMPLSEARRFLTKKSDDGEIEDEDLQAASN
jgi:predicted N-acetyltransferase YhbS